MGTYGLLYKKILLGYCQKLVSKNIYHFFLAAYADRKWDIASRRQVLWLEFSNIFEVWQRFSRITYMMGIYGLPYVKVLLGYCQKLVSNVIYHFFSCQLTRIENGTSCRQVFMAGKCHLRDFFLARHSICVTSIWATFCLCAISISRPPSCATFQLRDISVARQPSWATFQLTDISTARYSICATSHLRDFSIERHAYARQPICATFFPHVYAPF